MNYKTGAVQWLTSDVLSSTKVVTGLGFQPKAMKFMCNGLQSDTTINSNIVDCRHGVGYAVSSSSRRSVGSFSQDNAGSANCGSVAANDCVVITVNGAGTIDGKLDISSFDVDGFTLIVDDVAPANITVIWEAWGGDDITVAEVGDISEPAVTGLVNYTVTGFTTDGTKDQVIMFAGVQSTAALNTGQAQDGGINVGFATGTPGTAEGSYSMVCSDDDGSATADLSMANMYLACINKVIIGGAATNAINCYASLNAWITDGFTLSWGLRATTGRKNIYLAIKGGYWQGNTVNSVNTGGVGPERSVATPFVPIGVSAHGSPFITTAFVESSKAYAVQYGVADLYGNRISISVNQQDGVTIMNWYQRIDYQYFMCLYYWDGSVSNYQVEFSSFSYSVNFITGFATYFRILSFGSQRQIKPISVGHPFII